MHTKLNKSKDKAKNSQTKIYAQNAGKVSNERSKLFEPSTLIKLRNLHVEDT